MQIVFRVIAFIFLAPIFLLLKMLNGLKDGVFELKEFWQNIFIEKDSSTSYPG